jgi:hypothetical protein
MAIRIGKINLNGLTPGYFWRFNAATGEMSDSMNMENDVDSMPGRDVYVEIDRSGKGRPGTNRLMSSFSNVPSGTAGGNKTILFDRQPVFTSKFIKNGPIDPRKGQWKATTFDTFTKSGKFRQGV